MRPGVGVPWSEAAAGFGPLSGDPGIVENQWRKLAIAAYLYLWVHR